MEIELVNEELGNSSEFLSKSSSSTISNDSEHSVCSKVSSDGNEILKTIDEIKQIDIINNNSKDEINIKPVPLKVDPKIACLFLILGIGQMFPFQSFMASLDYFNVLFSDYDIASTFSFIYMASICCTFGFLLFFQKKLKQHIMLLIGLPLFMVIMILAPIINITSDKGTPTTYAFTLILIGCCAVVDALCQSCVFSLASLFGPQYTNFAQFGLGISGVIVLITRLICKLSFSSDLHGFKIGSIVFFSISAVVIVVTWSTFICFLRIPIGQTIMQKNKQETVQDNNNTATATAVKEVHPFKFVIKSSWEYASIVFYVFFITFLLFPGIVIEVTSSRISVDWYTFIIIATYNIADCVGKSLPALTHSKYILPIRYVWSIVIGRTLFIALFFLAIYTSIFNHEAWVLCFTFIFGVSNGYIASYALSEGPKTVERSYKSFTAILLQSSLNVGLLFGSALNHHYTLLQYISFIYMPY